MRFKKIIFVLFLSVIALFIQSCNEQPTGVGISLIYDTLSVKIAGAINDSILGSIKTVQKDIIIFNSSCYYVGRTDSLYAIGMIRIEYLDSNLAYLTADRISQCYLKMIPQRYSVGDTISNNLSFKIYKIKQYWSALTIADSIYDDKITFHSKFFDDVVQGSYSGHIALKDSMDPLNINLNPQLMIDWFKLKRDTSTTDWGIALIPDNNSNVIHQFNHTAVGTDTFSRSSVIIVYKDSNNVDNTREFLAGVGASIVTRKGNPPQDRIIIQGSTEIMTKINFNLSKIPRDAAILYSEMELTLDNSNSYNANSLLDSVIQVGIARDDNLDSTLKDISPGYRTSGTDKFVFVGNNINMLVEDIVRNYRTGNIVIQAQGFSEVRKIDQMAFFGPDCNDPDKRPKLKIVYTTRLKR